MKKMLIATLAGLALILGACSSDKEEKSSPATDQKQEQTTDHGGDIREETASAEQLPAFMKSQPEDTQTIYLAVAKNRELLEQMPCYCGCGESAGHKDNYDCFIHDNKKEAVVWDDHGTKCGVCLNIAADAINKLEQGMSVKDIRKAIDEQYKDYPNPTPTPEV